MLKLKCRVNVTESIRRGRPSESVVTLDLTELSTLTDREREMLAAHWHPSQGLINLMLPEASMEGLKEALAAAVTAADDKEWQDAANTQAAEEILSLYSDEEIADLFDSENGNWYGTAVEMTGINGEPSHTLQKVMCSLAKTKDWTAKHEERKASCDLESKRRAEEHERARREEHLAKTREREEWIEQHGSNRLRRCEAEGVECDAIYRDERLAIDRPGWRFYKDLPGTTKEPRNPPESAFTVLDNARKLEPEAELAWYFVKHECDEDCVDPHEPCPTYDVSRYVAEASFLGETILFGVE